ncbi:DUF4259 domain-containing protein [Paenibacillus sp. 2TAF8]|uniref:DUF4259 domain-containing protein n=1 Tax=Paenibacillus sp. 2TAF8 TaxID=3233020 RepID=UPI003F9B53F3
MGAWGTGIFENDDVLDWKANLLDSDGIEFIEEMIKEVLEDEYIESDLASNALGAIEILAALQGRSWERDIDPTEMDLIDGSQCEVKTS